MKIGIDLGGTTVGIGVVDENYKIVAETEMRTADCKTPDDLASIVIEGTRRLIESNHIDQKDITFIGMGCPGEIDTEKGIAVAADNLPIEKIPFAKLLTEAFGAPARLDNDANCAAWGEHMAGVSKGYKNIVTVTLGTGIGGGIIVDGKLLHGKENHAGEIGHMVIDIHGKQWRRRAL